MKEENGNQDVGATAFDYSNNMNPQPYTPAYHTKMRVPRPTNEAAKHTDASKVMDQVNHAKG